MPNLINTQTGKQESLKFYDIDNAIRSGNYKYPDSATINVKDPNGTDIYQAKGSQLQDLLNNGYRTENPLETAKREYLEDNSGLKGTAKVAIGQFANQLAFGVPEMIYDKVADPWDVDKINCLKEQHNIANIAGGVTGFVGSIAVGGPLFKMSSAAGELAERSLAAGLKSYGVERGSASMAKSFLAKLAPAVANAGAQGIVLSAPQALTEATWDPEAAAESLMAGGATGLIFGSAVGVGGELINGIKNNLNPFKGKSVLTAIDDVTDSLTAKSFGVGKAEIMKQARHSAPGEAFEDVKEMARIGKGATFIDPDTNEVKNVYNASDNAIKRLANVTDWHSQVGKKIGEVRDLSENLGYNTFYPRAIKQELIDHYGESEVTKQSWLDAPVGQAYKKIANYLDDAGLSAVPVSEAPNIKDFISQFAGVQGLKGIGDLALGITAGQENVALKNVLEKAVRDGKLDQNSKIYNDFLKAKSEYGASDYLLRSMTKKVAAIEGNKYVGLTDTITGGATSVAAAILSGGAAIPSIVAGAGSIALKHLAERYGPAFAATFGREAAITTNGAMKTIADKLSSIPEYLSSKGASATSASLSALARLSPNSAGQTKEAQVKAIVDRLNQVASNPITNNHVNDMAGYMANSGMPNTSAAFQAKIAQAINYLQSQAPRPISPANPLTPHKWSPSPAEISSFERKVQVVHDPLSVLDDFKNNTLTKDHVDAIKTVYPKLYTSMVNKIVDHAMSGNAKALSYSKRIKLGMLLGTPIDSSVQMTPFLQANWQKPQSFENMNNPDNVGGKNINFSRAQSTMSEMQRLV